jgi:hypothetical protein
MKPKSIIGEAAAATSRYDWGLMLATYALGVVAFRLGAPLWAAAIIAFSGHTVVGVKHTCRNLGLFDDHDVDEREATPSHTVASTPAGASSGVAGPSRRTALSSPPHVAGRP